MPHGCAGPGHIGRHGRFDARGGNVSVEVTRMALKRHELLEELQAVIARQLEEMGTAPDAASVIGSSAVDYLSTYWAGQVVTFPKDAQYKLTLKELEIYDQFDGRNKDDLARRYLNSLHGGAAPLQCALCACSSSAASTWHSVDANRKRRFP